MEVTHRKIAEWDGADRPREKLLDRGRRELSDAELLAILVGTGSKEESAVDLCRKILLDLDNDLNALAKRTVNELCAYRGMGEAKALRIVAALELGRRRRKTKLGDRPLLNSSRRVYEYLKHMYIDLPHEEAWALYLDTGGRLIRREMIGRGGNDFTPVDFKIVLRFAIDCCAQGIILSHNHPSGTLRASDADLHLTKRLIQAAAIIDVVVHDHIIFSDHGYYSFRDSGLIRS